jgi:hypothetical protein
MGAAPHLLERKVQVRMVPTLVHSPKKWMERKEKNERKGRKKKWLKKEKREERMEKEIHLHLHLHLS